MLNKTYAWIVLVLLLAIITVPASAGTVGTALTGVQLQNLSPTNEAIVNIQLWPQVSSDPVIDLTGPSGVAIAALSAKNFYLPSYSAVPSGSYALISSSTEQMAAIARMDWSATGGAAIYNSVAPATNISIPLVVKNYANQTSQFSIQNTDTTNDATDIVIKLYARGQSDALVTTPAQTIAKGTSKTYSLNDAIWGDLPNTALDTGATGFVGSIQITSAKSLVVQSIIDLPGTPGVTGFSGVATSSADTVLYCPLIRANYYGDTGISIVNPNSSQVAVEITFRADANSPSLGTFTQDLNIPANSSALVFQGPGGSSRQSPTNLPGGTQTTANPTPTNDGFYGVASIQATGGPILAVVNDTKFGTGWAVKSQSSYNCSTGGEAGVKFALPLVRRYHLSTTKLTTGIQIQNTSGNEVTVHVDLTNWDGTTQISSNPTDITIPAYGSGNFWSGSWTGLPTVPPSAGGYGWYGSAIITATGGNIVVVVSDEGYGTTAVDSANYNGLKIQ